jgi:hypothetical protein
MFKPFVSISIIALLTLNSVYAQDCLYDLSKALPAVVIPEVNLHVNTNTNFCFDIASEKNSKIVEKFNLLKKQNAFDENNCLIDKDFGNEINAGITDLIVETTREHLNVYAADPTKPNESTILVMTNSVDKKFIDKAMVNSNKLNFRDTLDIAGAVTVGTLVGIISERNLSNFKNKDGSPQHDKILHSNFGALINIGSVAGAYLAIETAGLGDKLNLTKNQKKWAILLTGTVVGLLVGYGKERFYDYYHKDIHTFDPHFKGDMGATWLGGGAMNVVGGSLSFQF